MIELLPHPELFANANNPGTRPQQRGCSSSGYLGCELHGDRYCSPCCKAGFKCIETMVCLLLHLIALPAAGCYQH
ncbi:hypothetical protein CCHOA_10260 [Corynebacterium choanae]|uniref:Uncharacterized protein n=1 Tax=Corynebacterium choanae TaxID=1862358 RepID=A0A3G6J8J9_9CORY|nr:hypothetical protein CCHOA_10260 [Corynebacterium choanae]